jgi:hypothetical protein
LGLPGYPILRGYPRLWHKGVSIAAYYGVILVNWSSGVGYRMLMGLSPSGVKVLRHQDVGRPILRGLTIRWSRATFFLVFNRIIT